MQLSPGQRWMQRTDNGESPSRLVIGAILAFPGHEDVVCCTVTNATHRRADGVREEIDVPFLPVSRGAFLQSVASLDGMTEPAPAFRVELEAWRSDPRGLRVFTVPFEGSFDRMIAMQMAAALANRNVA